MKLSKVKGLPELSPCPKCGSKPMMWNRAGGINACFGCGCAHCLHTFVTGATPHDVANDWNLYVEMYKELRND